MDGVEQQSQRGKCLGAMLDAKTKQDRASRADLCFDDGALAGNGGFAFQPSAQEHVVTRIPADEGR